MDSFAVASFVYGGYSYSKPSSSILLTELDDDYINQFVREDAYFDSLDNVDEIVGGTRYTDEITDGVRYINGKPVVINVDKQARHMIDTVQGTRSYLAEGVNAQKLLDDFAGTGDFIQSYKEVVNTGNTVGYYVDQVTGVAQETSRITIHYSKTGAHIVPAPPKK